MGTFVGRSSETGIIKGRLKTKIAFFVIKCTQNTSKFDMSIFWLMTFLYELRYSKRVKAKNEYICADSLYDRDYQGSPKNENSFFVIQCTPNGMKLKTNIFVCRILALNSPPFLWSNVLKIGES